MNLRALGLAGLIVGVLFKLLHWPGAGTIVLFSALHTAVAIELRIARRRVPWTIEISKPGWFAPAIVTALCGMMFKTMHWPGANIMLMLGHDRNRRVGAGHAAAACGAHGAARMKSASRRGDGRSDVRYRSGYSFTNRPVYRALRVVATPPR